MTTAKRKIDIHYGLRTHASEDKSKSFSTRQDFAAWGCSADTLTYECILHTQIRNSVFSRAGSALLHSSGLTATLWNDQKILPEAFHLHLHDHTLWSYLFTYFLSFVFLGPHLWHMEVPRLGVESELQSPPYATATTTQDPSHTCDLHCSSWQRWIRNPPSEARDRTRILMDTSQVYYSWAIGERLIFLKNPWISLLP